MNDSTNERCRGVSMILSSDGKNTVIVNANDFADLESMQEKTEALFDHLLEKYGTKPVLQRGPGRPPKPSYVAPGQEPLTATEREMRDAVDQSLTTEPTGYTCEQCGKPAEYKEGISKAGKPYKGIFCSDRDAGHVKWMR